MKSSATALTAVLATLVTVALWLTAMVRSPEKALCHHKVCSVHSAEHDDEHVINGTHARPVIDFYVRTWKGDGHWLTFMLRSIEAHVPRHVYRSILITYNKKEQDFFQSYLPLIPLPLVLIPEDDVFIRNGTNNGSYFSQMYSKFFPWKHSDADYFVHFDSDCVFTDTISKGDLMDKQNRVYVKAVNYSDLTGGHLTWKAPAEALLKEDISLETMTGFPFVFPRDLYQEFIAHVERLHGRDFLTVLRSMPMFNEFTPLGHFLTTHMPGRWVHNNSKNKKTKQQYSWAGLTPDAAAACERGIRNVTGRSIKS